MSDNFEFLATALTWIVHSSAIFVLTWQSRNRTYECKAIVTLYIFASVAPLFSFNEFQFFQQYISYTPSSVLILPYIATDIFLFLMIRNIFPVNTLYNRNEIVWSLEMQFGFKVMLLIAILAQSINIAFNFNLLFLPKHEFIAAMGTDEFVPNLFFYNIPADSLLVGGWLFNPFKNKNIRHILSALAVFTILMSFMQGYRYLLLCLLLISFFRWKYQGNILLVVIVLSVIGELSNPLKYLFGGIITTPNFPVLEFIEYELIHIDEFIGLSTEQKAIVSNLLIGSEDIHIGAPFFELHNLIPFTNKMIEDVQTGSGKISQIVGADIGQGTGYSLQLFIIETMFLGFPFLWLIMILVRKSAQSMFTVASIELFFSILRNTPEFWSGQIKMFCMLVTFVYCISIMVRRYGRT